MRKSDSPLCTAADGELACTPLYPLHLNLGARMVAFAGYAMPLQYSTGIIDEHLHTRREAGLFDVSHMGQAILSGPRAVQGLEELAPGDIVTLAPGKMRYTQLLDENGHIIDDMMVTRLDDEGGRQRLLLVVNAAMKQDDFAHIRARLPDCALTIRDDDALLALQGPRAADVLRRCLHVEKEADVTGMPFMSAAGIEWQGIPLHISRSGYTGEDGFEISIPASAAVAFAELLLGDRAVRVVGLGARDTLRLEAGLCLYGHDIDRTTNPIEAGLGWSIPRRRHLDGGFLGYSQLKHAFEYGPARRRIGMLVDGGAPAREGAAILGRDGQQVGRVTSGGYAPSLKRPIAMGYVETPSSAPGTELSVLVRDKPRQAKIVLMPFVPHHYFRSAK